MNNFEKVCAILSKVEKGHINLYHDISKDDLFSYVNKIEWDNLSDIKFDYYMLKIFNKFKDAHTRYFVKNIKLDNKFIYKDNKLYVFSNDKYNEVILINNKDISYYVYEFESLISYETNEWKKVQLELAFNNKYFYTLLNEDSINCKLIDNTYLLVNEKEDTIVIKNKSYEHKILNDNILYLRYSACKNDDILFSDYVSLIENEVKQLNVKKYILDIRGNAGGDSKIIHPFRDLVREHKLNGVILMDNGVFSSGRFILAEFKKEFNTILIGTSSGGAAKSYGYNNNDKVEDKGFSYSIRLWDFSSIFNDEGSIKPDIEVDNSINDLENNYDRMLVKAIEIIKGQS